MREAVPDQPVQVAGILAGNRVPAGVLTPARAADYADAIELARLVAERAGAPVRVDAETDRSPWHAGRCARVSTTDGRVAGYAGELAPKVTQALGLPARTVAFELDLDVLLAAAPAEPVPYRPVSTFPAAKEDIALVVPAEVPAGDLLSTVREAGGDLAEDVRLFDSYSADSLGAGKKSLAFSLRLRAADRTLTAAETAAVRDAVVALARERFGAELRS